MQYSQNYKFTRQEDKQNFCILYAFVIAWAALSFIITRIFYIPFLQIILSLLSYGVMVSVPCLPYLMKDVFLTYHPIPIPKWRKVLYATIIIISKKMKKMIVFIGSCIGIAGIVILSCLGLNRLYLGIVMGICMFFYSIGMCINIIVAWNIFAYAYMNVGFATVLVFLVLTVMFFLLRKIIYLFCTEWGKISTELQEIKNDCHDT